MIENILEFIESHRAAIGLGLLGLIIVGGVVLLMPRGKTPIKAEAIASNPVDTKRIETLEKTVNQLTERVNELSQREVVQTTTEVAQGQGKVAGVSTSNQNTTKSTVQPVKTAQATSNSNPTTTQTTPGKVNINSATTTQLDTLPGIGATYAKGIIDYRTAHNGFKSIEEIKEVKGIGDKTFLKLKDLITI